MRNKYSIPFLLIFFTACTHTSPLRVNFDSTTTPTAPDYSNEFYWAALPDKSDYADHIPVDYLSDNQSNAKADVFYLHPTSFFSKKNWNAQIENRKLIEETDTRSILHQASVFNGSCKVYAPRYRQVSYHAYFSQDNPDAQYAFALAYTDIQNAFNYYLEHFNNGRPIIIAAHSQGTTHAIQLIKDFFDGTPLENKLIAAYLIGMPVSATSFDAIAPCDTTNAIHCYVSWRSFLSGYTPKKKFAETYDASIIVINPLTWTANTGQADAQLNLGGLSRKANAIYPAVATAQIHDNYLWISKPDIPGKAFLFMKNYHIADYNLYWMNIRTNVEERINAYFKSLESLPD